MIDGWLRSREMMRIHSVDQDMTELFESSVGAREFFPDENPQFIAEGEPRGSSIF